MSGTLSIVLFVVVIIAASGLVYRLRRSHQTELDRQRQQFEQRLAKLRERQTAQVRRLERERDKIKRTAHLELADDLLDALDDFDNVLDQQTIDDDLREGLEMIRRKLLETLSAHGVDRIEPDEADAFDPERHEALRAIDPDEAEPGTIVHCHRAGYRFDERTLRPAAVDVAVGRDTEESPEQTPSSATEEADTSDQQTIGTTESQPADEDESVSQTTSADRDTPAE